MTGRPSVVVRVRGKTYGSVAECAKKLRVSVNTVYWHLHRGTPDKIGVGPGGPRRGDQNGRSVSFVLDGQRFSSLREAAEVLGVSYNRIKYLRRRIRDAGK